MDDATRAALEGGAAISIPALAKALGLSRNGAYEAVKRKEIAVTRLGRRIIVPAREARRLLGMDPAHPSVEDAKAA